MAVKFLRYFMLFFLFIMFFLLFKDPYAIEYKSIANQPDIELFNVKNLEISKDGVISIVFTDKINRYKNYDVLYMIDALHKGELGLVDALIANKGILKKDILYLSKNVKYTRSDNISLVSDDIKYDLKKRVLSSNKNFKFIKKNSETTGDSFIYQMQKGIITADKIKTIIKVDR